MKLNMGCGRHILPDYTNVDIQASEAAAPLVPDILCDLRTVPLPDQVAEEVMAIHVFEHFYYWETPAVITEWRRLLQPGGKLVLELPDLKKCCANIVEGLGLDGGGKNPHALGLWGLYGDPREEDPYMHHKWGWCPETLTNLLVQFNFERITEQATQWHRGGRKRRDMRIEAYRPL